MADTLVASGLTKRYGTLEAVRGIDFLVSEGECLGFLAPNGAGKTTPMKMIACSAPPSAVTPMFLFSGIFFPLDRLPDVIEGLAWFTPLYHGVNLMRSLWLTGDIVDALSSATWIVAVTALLFVLPLHILRRRLVK
jgi:energy-coupling factor transporter ATP-binding protein EcfA2